MTRIVPNRWEPYLSEALIGSEKDAMSGYCRGENKFLSIRYVYLGMCCDPLHRGHIAIIQRAKNLGHIIIGLLTDEAIATYKSSSLENYRYRKEQVQHIECVEEIVPQKTLDYVPNLLYYRPAYVVHGSDWRSGIQKGTRSRVIRALNIWGGRLVELPYTKGISSSMFREMIRQNRSLAAPAERFIAVESAPREVQLKHAGIEAWVAGAAWK